jgi:hypothetical protein
MTWNYGGAPATSATDAARFWAGDTISTAQTTLQDGEVAYCVALEPNDARLAGALCCEALAAKYVRMANITVGEVSRANGDRYKAYQEQAEKLRDEAGRRALPSFGGQSVAEKNSLTQNPDAVKPPFGMGQFDNPLTTQFDNQPPDPGYPVV